MSPAQAEKLQDDIYRTMTPTKKLKILGDFYLFGKKLNSLKQKYENRKAGRPFTSNRKNSK